MLDVFVLNVFDAAVPAFVLVSLDGAFVWDKAEPAADFAVLLELLLRKTFDAAVAAFLLVTSFFAMIIYSHACIVA